MPKCGNPLEVAVGPKQPMPRWFAFPGAYIALGVILFASAWLAGFWYAPDKLVQVKHVTHEAKVDSADDIRAMGEATPVACEELNIPPELECAGYQGPDFSVILVTAP